ncbi:MAG: dipeptidase, partial [Bacteroidota bacterium]|nr:dipeptidase [Bacteroidota bacterium]
MKKLVLTAALALALWSSNAIGCTNFLVTPGASVNGTAMITYAADAHVLYGELYFTPSADYPPGTLLDVYEWDTNKFLGRIPQ